MNSTDERKGAAGGTALLEGLQDLADGFAVVIGGAAGSAAAFRSTQRSAAPGCLARCRGCRMKARCKPAAPKPQRWHRCALIVVESIVAKKIAISVGVRSVADVQGFLNGRKRDFGRVFDLFGVVRHVQSEPSLLYTRPAGLARLSQAVKPVLSPSAARKRDRGPACPRDPETSYWLRDANEMAAINTILIIVNNAAP